MSKGLGFSREGQNSGREGEHKVGLTSSPSNTPQALFSNYVLNLFFCRTLCDNLRRERDRAVSDLADALRNLDDMRKQKNDALRELKELK